MEKCHEIEFDPFTGETKETIRDFTPEELALRNASPVQVSLESLQQQIKDLESKLAELTTGV